MFERFTEQACKAVVLAQEEAWRLDHGYIGTERLLLGLLRQDQRVAAHALGTLGVNLDEAREQVESVTGRGGEGIGEGLPFNSHCKNVFELALREALQLGNNTYIGTEYLLLGLVQEKEGTASRVLSNLGVDPGEIRRQVVEMIGSGRTERRPVAHPEDSRYTRAIRASLIRTRVEGLLVHARCGVTDEERALPQTLRVDLEYAYRVGEGDEIEETVDYGAILQGVAGLLEREEFKLLETGVRRVGVHVLESFPEIWEITVRLTKLNVPVTRTVSGVSVDAIFRR